MKMMMMMSTSDEDNDDDSDAHAKAAKDMADHIQTELVSNRQNVFPMYHSIAASGSYGDRRRDGEEIEDKSVQKGKKRKSNDVLLKSIAERNKDKSKRIEIAGGISLPAPIRTKTTKNSVLAQRRRRAHE